MSTTVFAQVKSEKTIHKSSSVGEKPLLANLHVRFRPGYATFIVHRTSPTKGYLTMNKVKVAAYTLSRKKTSGQVTVARIVHSHELINVNKSELRAGVAKAQRAWKKDKESRGRYLMGWRVRRGKRPSKRSKRSLTEPRIAKKAGTVKEF
jgi:hypothetical protein